MATAVMGSDIDSFIREQKAKLASERHVLNDEDRQPSGGASRRHWDRNGGQDAQLAVEESRPRTQEGGLPLTNISSRQKQRELAEQRQREYNQYLKKGKGSRTAHPQDDDEISNPSIIPFNRAEEDRARKRRMEEERHREYQQMKAKLDEAHRRGRREDSREQRYQPIPSHQPDFQQRPGRTSLLEQTDEYKANLPGRGNGDVSRMEKERQRNEEYNQFLRKNNTGRRTQASDRDVDSEYYATLPGLRDSHSAKVRKEQQRNQEYNQFLASRQSQRDRDDGKPPPAPRKGWATPTYEDLLDQKREQEAQYRRNNDPGYGQPLGLDSRLDRLSRESDSKRQNRGGNKTQDLMLEYREVLSRLQDFNQNKKQREPLDLPRNLSPRNPSPAQPPRTREAPRGEPSQCYATLPIGSDGPARPSRSQPGPTSTEEAKRRQKEQYRDELQKQMREAAEGRRREKQAGMNITYSGEKAQDMKTNYSGFLDPEERKAPPLPLANASRPTQPPPAAPSRLDKFDRLSTRSELALGRQRLEDLDRNQPLVGPSSNGLLDAPFSLSRGGGGGGGLLDNGFSNLLEAPRISNLAPPPGLEYQPASYITKGGGGLGLTSVENAYDFYATHNPLDTNLPVARGGDGGGGGGGGLSHPVRASQDRSYTGRAAGAGAGGGGAGGLTARDQGGGGRAKVRFDDEPPRHIANMDFPTDDDKKREAQKKAQAYQEELNRQIEEKRRKKLLEKEEKDRYDRRLEQEAVSYNPYGRGGGGAPMRDAYGNIVSDLRSMRRDNNSEPESRPPPPPSQPIAYTPSAPAAASTRDDLFGPPPTQTTADGELSHARGGHGIFGMPKTNEEKVASERYKDDLRRQIEERKVEEMRRKELERQEEEREQRRLDEQRQHMQQEYEDEQRRIKEKEEEARKKNEELVHQAEERKREAELRRKEAEEKRMEEERREKEREMNARLANVERGKSPVIPALRSKVTENANEGEARAAASPPVPAARTRAAEDEPLPSTSKEESAPVSRAASADVLNQLAVMRKQLQSERQRVEDMLQTEKKAPDVFDPRLMQKVPASKPEMDVFETARHGNAVAVRRTPGDRGNAQAMEDFNALRHIEDSDSRKEFRKLFPEKPASGDTLEVQQAAFLRQQEQSLRALRDQSKDNESGYPKTTLPLPASRAQTRTPHQLNSNSAFVDVDGLNYFPDDFEDMPGNRRNKSARARRRNRQDLSPRAPSRGYATDPFGSTTSLNVDRLAKKNEDRLKRLRELQGDDMSLYDPDDVLDRFMSKQAHNRPPSGQTLQDDSWMYTGAASKASGY